jgi:ornithine racemase
VAELLVHLSKLRDNALYVKELCTRRGVELVAVTKGCNAFLPILEVLRQCGIGKMGMSKVGDAIKAEPFLSERPLYLSVPAPHMADTIASHFGASLNSELGTIQALTRAAARQKRPHGIILLVDVGDLREGVMPEDVVPLVQSVLELNPSSIQLWGLGATLGCCSGTLPDAENMGMLQALTEKVEEDTGFPLKIVTVGGSVVIPLLEGGFLPGRINQVRIGEAILLGHIPAFDQPHHALSNEGFLLRGTVVEVKEKPSLPSGRQGKDVFGQQLTFEDRGIRRRCILDFGIVDTYPRGLTPLLSGMEFINSNSDYTIMDASDAEQILKPGDKIDFTLNYQALIRALHSNHLGVSVIP